MGAGAHNRFPLNNINKDIDCIVEIGSDRGFGSTEYLAKYSREIGIPFYTVDFNDDVYNYAKKFDGATAFLMKGETFMTEIFPTFESKIKFAYLDNFDWTYVDDYTIAPWIKDQREDYANRGVVMTNENSQKAHLIQTIEISKYATDDCIILFDDTWETDNGFTGKGGTAVPWLLENGWIILESNRPEQYVAIKKG